MRRQLHAQEYLGQKQRITIRQTLEDFCESKRGTPNHKNLVIQTKALNRLMRTNRYMDEITSEDTERLKRDRLKGGTSPSTLKHTFSCLRGAWKYSKRMGYQVSDFEFPEVKLPKPRLRYLSSDEEKRLLEELNPKREGTGLKPYSERSEKMKRQQQDAYDLVVLLLDTGARHSEIANLEWNQVDFQEKAIRLWRPKVENESILYMTDRVYRVIHRRRENNTSGYVFTNKLGGKRGYASQAIRKAFRRAGLGDCTVLVKHFH